jgi:sortase A
MKGGGRGNGINALALLLAVVGIGVLFYPTISDLWNRQFNTQNIHQYQKKAEQLTSEQKRNIWEAAWQYNADHSTNTVTDVFSKKKSSITKDERYTALLDPSKNGIMGSVEIPKIRLRLAIYHGTSAAVLEKGVGHVQGTSLPVGGSGTHAVLAAHRGLPSAKLFTDLDQIKKGNHFYLVILGQTLAYRVDKISVVKPDALDALAIEPGRDLVTLLTCTPYGVNTERLLVRGHRVPYVPKTKAAEKGPLIDRNLAWKLLLVGLMSVAVILIIMKRRMADRQATNARETKE